MFNENYFNWALKGHALFGGNRWMSSTQFSCTYEQLRKHVQFFCDFLTMAKTRCPMRQNCLCVCITGYVSLHVVREPQRTMFCKCSTQSLWPFICKTTTLRWVKRYWRCRRQLRKLLISSHFMALVLLDSRCYFL